MLEAIRDADLILIGPGSLYTSIIPNLLVEGVAEAIAQLSRTCVYIANLMTQPGETEHYSVADHVRAIYEHTRRDTVRFGRHQSQADPAGAAAPLSRAGRRARRAFARRT